MLFTTCTAHCAACLHACMRLCPLINHVSTIARHLGLIDRYGICFQRVSNTASSTVRGFHGAPRGQADDRRPPHGSRWAFQGTIWLVRAKNARTPHWRPAATSATTASSSAVWRLDPAYSHCFDPVLCFDALRRHQQLWQIDGHGCAASQNGINWTPSKCCRTRTRTPWTLWCCRTGWTSWKTIAAARNLLPANPLRARPSPGHCCNASLTSRTARTLRDPLPAMQDHGLGNVLLAALAPSLASGVSAAPQPELRWRDQHRTVLRIRNGAGER